MNMRVLTITLCSCLLLLLPAELPAQWTNLGLQSMPLRMTSDYHGIRLTNVPGPTPANGSVWTTLGTDDDWVTEGQRSTGGGGALGCCVVEALDFLSDSLGFMLSSNQGLRSVARTTDAGMTWQALAPGAQTAMTPIADLRATDANSAYLIGHGASPFSTQALRVSAVGHTQVFSSGAFEGSDGRILFLTDSLGMVIVRDSSAVYKLLRTTDAGVTWSQRLAVGVGPLRAIDFVDATTGYVAGASGVCYKTTDAGWSWTSLAINGPVDVYAMDIADAQTGYLGCAGGLVLRTTDGGNLWSSSVLDSNITIVYIKAISPTMAYALGSDSVLYKRDYIAGADAAWEPALTVTAFPNPTEDMLQLALPAGWRLKSWQLYNLQGQRLLQGTDPQVDMGALASGVYVLEVLTHKGLQRMRVLRE
jgi:photosystem II stability/assembly factor-like uncharacterized protein